MRFNGVEGMGLHAGLGFRQALRQHAKSGILQMSSNIENGFSNYRSQEGGQRSYMNSTLPMHITWGDNFWNAYRARGEYLPWINFSINSSRVNLKLGPKAM